jgi:hypothetical protein
MWSGHVSRTVLLWLVIAGRRHASPFDAWPRVAALAAASRLDGAYVPPTPSRRMRGECERAGEALSSAARVSCVGVGSGADIRLLSCLAIW